MVASPNAPRDLAAPPASRPGFAIRLPSAQLGDLIQINCLNRIVGSFRVSSNAGEGYLFFHGGHLVHAVCGEQIGLDAMVVMLGWRGGSIEPCVLPWPDESSIDMGADALLLCAAQRLDERLRHDDGRVDMTTKVVRRVSLPERASAGPSPQAGPVIGVPLPPARASAPSGVSLRGSLPLESLARLEVTRVTADGNIQTSRAGASTDLADTAFYCQRLASLIGEGLGLGACRAFACENAREGIVVFEGRSIVGARGQRSDLAPMLAKLRLG
jgi:hypothetical protein